MNPIHAGLISKTYKNNIPLMCVFELTHRCNLKCAHCYICRKDIYSELSTEEVKKILRQIASCGCMYVVFTGGEALLRKDIFEICGFAKSLHFDVRIFSNAVLIDRRIAVEIKNSGVSGVEVSLYGRADVHDSVTGVLGSFNETRNGLMAMKERGIAVTVKCPVMNVNFREYEWVFAFAEKNGFGRRFDITVSPKDDGGRGPLKLRLGKTEIKEVMSKLGPSAGKKQSGYGLNTGFSCSAGKNFFSITPYGKVLPCLQLPIELGNIREHAFSEIWNSAKTRFVRKIGMENIKQCSDCGKNIFCRRCPGFAMIEDGDLFGPSKIACRIAAIQSAV